MAEEGTDHETVREAIQEVKDIPVVATVLRPRPVEPIEGKRVAFFTTASASAGELLERHLREEHGAADVAVSCNLANREKLREDLDHIGADVYVIEIKAAAIDVVCEAREGARDRRGLRRQRGDSAPGQLDLDEALRELLPATEAVA